MMNDEIVVLSKICAQCGLEKSIDEFNKQGKKKDGSTKN